MLDARWLRALRRAVGRARPEPRSAAVEAKDLVWIMGSPRTGSTWLLTLLAGSTDGARINEPWIAPHLGTPASVLSGWPDTSERTIFDVASDRHSYVFADAHQHIWAPVLRDLVLTTLEPKVASPRTGSDLVFVKEPVGASGAPMLMRCLPEARLLFLVRDGRDVVDSIIDALDGGWVTELAGITVEDTGRRDLVASCARGWVRDTDAVQRAYDSHAPDRRLLVRYEDLRSDTEAEVERMLRWLEHPADPAKVREQVARIAFDRVPDAERGRGKFHRAAQPGLWRDHFDGDEVELLHSLMGKTLRRYGYS